MLGKIKLHYDSVTPPGEWHACKNSGFCCKQTPCKWGVEKGSPKLQACKFLGGEKPGQHFCTLYDEIVAKGGGSMFGSGCRASRNPDRKGL